jgi:miniconductance mechanosensitive channel
MNLEIIKNLFDVSTKQAQSVSIGMVLVISFVAYLLTKYVLMRVILQLSKKTKTLWDDMLIERKVFNNLSYIIPLVIIYYSAYMFPVVEEVIRRFSKALIIWFSVLAVSALLSAVNDIYLTTRRAKEKPIKGYLQIIKIFFFIVGSIVVLGIILGKSPWIFVSGLGAMTAILLLIFKDTILSLMASLQISFNDLVKIGDWLSVPQFNADGNVIDIALHTVKIQNWDKTISVIPTHKLIEGTFKNWRGMELSGGRRIKRSFNIDINTIKFCDEKMLKKFEKFHYLQEYLKNKQAEVKDYNNENNIDTTELINGKNLTNIGTLRAYIIEFLKHHPHVRKDMTFLIRQLAPTPTGVPIEVYVFIDDIRWANYEGIQADIFDHILAVVPEFELKIFQNISSINIVK